MFSLHSFALDDIFMLNHEVGALHLLLKHDPALTSHGSLLLLVNVVTLFYNVGVLIQSSFVVQDAFALVNSESIELSRFTVLR